MWSETTIELLTEDLMEHPTGAPAVNGQYAYRSPDGGSDTT
jgi:hypothetical protein